LTGEREQESERARRFKGAGDLDLDLESEGERRLGDLDFDLESEGARRLGDLDLDLESGRRPRGDAEGEAAFRGEREGLCLRGGDLDRLALRAGDLDFELLGAFFLRSLSLEAGELERPRVRLAGRGESLRLLDTDLLEPFTGLRLSLRFLSAGDTERLPPPFLAGEALRDLDIRLRAKD